jgi:PTS system mannose-specific IID component
MTSGLERGVRLRLFLRLMLLQATWSFERMQGLGFAFALEPWLERIYPDLAERRAALERHSEYFNTQPYAASLVLGCVCAMEESAAALPAAQRAAAYERLRAVKRTMGSGFGGLGDSFFWSALRPAAAAAALVAGLTAARAGWAHAGLATAAVYLAAYNIPAVWLRWRGLALGYAWREQLPVKLKTFEIQAWVRRVRLAGTVLALGGFLLLAASAEPSLRLFGALTFGFCWAAYLVLPGQTTALRLYGLGCAAGLFGAAAGWL